MSPAMKLIMHVYQHEGHGRGRSRQQSSEAVSSAVKVAIRYGLKWDKGDFAALAKQRRQSYHDTSVYQSTERDYSLACGSDRASANPTAATSYEAWRNRKPFLLCDRSNVTPTRVYVGRRIEWYGDDMEVTSFNDVEGYFIAVKHRYSHADSWGKKPKVGEIDHYMGEYRKVLAVSDDGLTVTYSAEPVEDARPDKVIKRVKITHADIKAYHDKLKELREASNQTAKAAA